MKSDNVIFNPNSLSGLGLRVKDQRLISSIVKIKSNTSLGKFIRAKSLKISPNTLSNWLNLKYGFPLDAAINIIGEKQFQNLGITRFSSGKASSYCSATLPRHHSLELMYILGTIIGDGSLNHSSNGSYFIKFEMKDISILTIIQKLFLKIFGVHKSIVLVHRKDGRKIYLLKYSNKSVYYFFNRFFGITPRKAKTVRIKLSESMSRDGKIALLLGLYHTDGSLVKNSLRFYTSSPHLKDDVRSILTNLGYPSRYYSYKRKHYTEEYHVYVKNSRELLSEFTNIETILSN